MRRIQAGFTLIELMIVVAIIAILAALAIPNFARFQVRSRQSEARTNLRAIFTTLEAQRAETGRYSTCNGFCGFTVQGQGIPAAQGGSGDPLRGVSNRYQYRIGAGGVSLAETIERSVVATDNRCDNQNGSLIAPVKVDGPPPSFSVIASANLDDDVVCDIMGINQGGVPTFSNNGTANVDDDSTR
jgi:type IV pilus assembly protein PilA